MTPLKEKNLLKVDYHNYSHITLNTPKKLNAFSYVESQMLHTSLKICESNADTKFIILSGAGKAFCSGGDLKSIGQYVMGKTYEDLANFYCMVFAHHLLIYFMATLETPLICYMDGITAGGGTVFPQLSAFKIATENTVFSIPECRVGHFSDASNSFTLSRLEGQLGVYLALTGDQIKAEDVLFAGLASHFVLSSNLKPLENKISQLNDINLDTINSIIQEFEVKIDHHSTQYTLHGEKLKLIERCFKYDTVEEIVAALKREDSEFARRCLKALGFNSPTAMKVTLTVIRYAKNKTFTECLDYEYRAWRTLPFHHDYQEGVRAIVIEKRRPQWNPAKIENVKNIELDFFSSVTVAPTYRLDLDFKTRKCEMFLLPTAQKVREIELKHGLRSNSDVIKWFVYNRKQKFGVREKVTDILKRRDQKAGYQKNVVISEQESYLAKL